MKRKILVGVEKILDKVMAKIYNWSEQIGNCKILCFECNLNKVMLKDRICSECQFIHVMAQFSHEGLLKACGDQDEEACCKCSGCSCQDKEQGT